MTGSCPRSTIPPSSALFLVSLVFTIPWKFFSSYPVIAFERPASPAVSEPPAFDMSRVATPAPSPSPSSAPVTQAKFTKRLLVEAEEIEKEDHRIAMSKIDSLLEARKSLYRSSILSLILIFYPWIISSQEINVHRPPSLANRLSRPLR